MVPAPLGSDDLPLDPYAYVHRIPPLVSACASTASVPFVLEAGRPHDFCDSTPAQTPTCGCRGKFWKAQHVSVPRPPVAARMGGWASRSAASVPSACARRTTGSALALAAAPHGSRDSGRPGCAATVCQLHALPRCASPRTHAERQRRASHLLVIDLKWLSAAVEKRAHPPGRGTEDKGWRTRNRRSTD